MRHSPKEPAIIDDSELDYDDEQRLCHGDNPVSGTVISSDVHGPTETEYRDGLVDGQCRRYYRDQRRLRACMHHRRGVLHGMSYVFTEDGRIATIEVYEVGMVTRRLKAVGGSFEVAYDINRDPDRLGQLESMKRMPFWTAADPRRS